MHLCDQYRMNKRTTLLLDSETRTAAHDLAHRYECSVSEAIRRAVLRHRDAIVGIPTARREERVRILDHLFELFDGHDAADEIRRLKEQDEGF